jgi:hypothetical protein
MNLGKQCIYVHTSFNCHKEKRLFFYTAFVNSPFSWIHPVFSVMYELCIYSCRIFLMRPHVPYGLCGLPPGCGRSVTDF